jgi:hypothetical protein
MYKLQYRNRRNMKKDNMTPPHGYTSPITELRDTEAAKMPDKEIKSIL